MLNKKLLVVLIAAVALLALSCECDCQFTKEECLRRYTDLEVKEYGGDDQPVPGPIVDLEPGAEVFTWRLNAGGGDEELLEPTAGPIFDEDPEKRCLLRKDFVGYKTSTFAFFTKPDGAELPYPAIIHLESEDGLFMLDIIYSGREGGLEWWASQISGLGRQRCKLRKGPITHGTVPNEFGLLDVDKLVELYNPDLDGKNIELRVEF